MKFASGKPGLVRRGLAVACSAALLFALTACGGEAAPGETTATTEGAGGTPALDATTISGGFGEEPQVQVGDVSLATEHTERMVLEEGDGPELTADRIPMLMVATFDFANGQPLAEYQPQPGDKPLSESQLPDYVVEALEGTPSGSRIALLVNTAAEMEQPGAQSTSMLLFVVDVMSVEPGQAADGKPVKNDIEFITVSDNAGGAPSVEIAEDAQAPDEQQTSLVLEGDGATIAEGDTVVLQYTGRLLDGTEFDSSWSRNGAPSMFPTDMVVPGFGKALVGQQVGSRVVTVFPPELGYGDQEQGKIPPNSHLIFVVDIIDVIPASK